MSLFVACLLALFCAVKLRVYLGPIAWEAASFDRYVVFNRYVVFAESILHGTLETGGVDQTFLQNIDPYEPKGRQGAFGWDYSYYKGKQYHYASFLPSLLFVIPFKFFFGFYPSEQIQIIGSTFFTVFAVCLLICKFLEVFMICEPQHKPFHATCFLFCLCGSGIFLSFADNKIYTIPAYQGLAFLSLAFVFLLTACQKSDLKIWMVACLFYILAVASRPPLLFYGPAFMAVCYKFGEKRKNLQALAIFASFVLACAAGLGAINDARFENPFEFGNYFQLNEFNNQKYPFVPNSLDLLMQRLPRGLRLHLLNGPKLLPTYPFISFWPYVPPWVQRFIHSPMNAEGIVGTLVLLPVLMLAIPALIMTIPEKRDWRWVFITVLLICSTWMLFFEASLIWVADRYALDYRLYLTLCAMVGVSLFLARSKTEQRINDIKKDLVYGCFGWTFFISIVAFVLPYHG